MKLNIILLVLLISFGQLFSQSLELFGIDSTSFPVMKAKFYAFDANQKQIKPNNPSDILLTENGTPRTVISVNCPPDVPAKDLSVVISVDVSGSMLGTAFDLAKYISKELINAIPLGTSECAVTSFDESNYLNHDFSVNRNVLLNAVDGFKLGGGTDFNKALLEPVAGAILVEKAAKHKKIIILISDGQPNRTPDENQIINLAKSEGIIIHSISVGNPAHSSMKNISVSTGGLCFDNINSNKYALEIVNIIVNFSRDILPCDFSWQSSVACSQGQIDAVAKLNEISCPFSYNYPDTTIANLKFLPTGLFFRNKKPGVKADTNITVTAENASFDITDIKSTNSCFSITPVNFSLSPGQSIQLTVSYTPPDSNGYFGIFSFENNNCLKKYYVKGAWDGKKYQAASLKITHPNGGDLYIAGTDSLISWEGVLPEDVVSLEYSTDNGSNWNLLTNTASNLFYKWKNMPRITSNQCLAKVSFNRETTPSIQWQKSLGGSNSDYVNSIKQTSDGGYVGAGWTYSNDGNVTKNNGASDVFVFKLDNSGNLQWQKTYGGSKDDRAFSICETTDGGFALAGMSYSNDFDVTSNLGGYNYWVLKLDINGNLEWQKTYGGSDDEYAYSVIQTKDGGYIVAGGSKSNNGDVESHLTYKNSDAWILKLSPAGKIQWSKVYGGDKEDVAHSIVQTDDGGYVFAGWTSSYDSVNIPSKGNYDFWAVRIDSVGKVIWQKCYGGSSDEQASSVCQTPDGGFIIAGYSNSNDSDLTKNSGGYDFWIVKTDKSGNIEWQQSYGGSNDDKAFEIGLKQNGGYVAGGWSESTDGDITEHYGQGDYWIISLDNSGNIVWQKTLGGSSDDEGFSAAQTIDGGYIIAGASNSNDNDITGNHGYFDCWVVKLTTDGENQHLQDVSDSLWSLVKPSLTFADIDMGQVQTTSYRDSVISAWIKNPGVCNCYVKDISFSGSNPNDFSLISSKSYVLSPGETKNIELHFEPLALGLRNAKISVITQDSVFSGNVIGEGVEPQIALETNIVDFGPVKISVERDTSLILLKNVTSFPVSISNTAILGPDLNDFFVVSGGGQFTLKPNETKEIKLGFLPMTIGRTSSELAFYYNGSGSPAKVQLFGQGIGGFVYVDNDSGYPGQKINLKFKINGINLPVFKDYVSSYSMKLQYNATLLAPVNSSNDISVSGDTASLTIVNSIKVYDLLDSMDFWVGLGNNDSSFLNISDFNWLDGNGNVLDYDTQTQGGVFKLLGICSEGGLRLVNPSGKAGIMNLAPNPANDEFELKINLTEIGKTEISIFNILGEKVKSIFVEDVSQTGERLFKVSTLELGDGSYMLQFRSPTVSENKQILIVR